MLETKNLRISISVTSVREANARTQGKVTGKQLYKDISSSSADVSQGELLALNGRRFRNTFLCDHHPFASELVDSFMK